MRRIAISIIIIMMGLVLVGFRPRPYSDLAEYNRLPMPKRIRRMQKIGEDYFLRREYETATQVFETILSLDKNNLSAKLWITKVKQKLLLEHNETAKKRLFNKYGSLTPKDLIYGNWTWGPTVGHFEVKYSKPKPYVKPVRKVHPKATDKQLALAIKKAKSNKAPDLFELAMQHWSRRETNEAIDSMMSAVSVDPTILMKDDELLLATAENTLDKKIESGKAKPNDLLARGKLAMIQGDTTTGIRILTKSASFSDKLKKQTKPLLLKEVKVLQSTNTLVPADIFSFRQAYVFEEQKNLVYVAVTLQPKPGKYIVPLDITLPKSLIQNIETKSKDILFVHDMASSNEMTTRLWLVLSSKDDPFASYNIKFIITLKPKVKQYIELSNFNIASEQPDNWSFVIGPEVSFSGGMQKGEVDEVIDGIKVSGFQLGLYNGRGPTVPIADFNSNPLPKKINVWKIMQNGTMDNI